MVIVDSHCHLSVYETEQEIDDCIKRAAANDVKYMLAISTHPDNIEKSIEIAEKYENVYCSIGLHPESFLYADYDISKFLNKGKVIAIGEVGLDYHHEYPREQQINLFVNMLELSRISGLPYVIHARECFPDILDMISDYGNVSGVFHCYTDSLENAKRVLDMGFYISFSGVITFKKSNALREVLRYVPNDRLLIETDAPFLAPEPHRGKANEPAYTRFVAERAALEKGISIEELAEMTTNNFFRLFNGISKLYI
jgi:TatD DNase family protein